MALTVNRQSHADSMSEMSALAYASPQEHICTPPFLSVTSPDQSLLKAGLQPVPAFALGSIFHLITERRGLFTIQHDHHEVPPSTLTAREVCQVLREVVLGRRTMTKIGSQSWEQLYACHFEVDVEGWRITIYNDCDELDYCERCVSPDGLRWDFDLGDRADPIALLSTWEHQTLELLLKDLKRDEGVPCQGRLSESSHRRTTTSRPFGLRSVTPARSFCQAASARLRIWGF